MIQLIFNAELQKVGEALGTPNREFTNNKWQANTKKIQVNFGKLSKAEADALIAEVDRQAASGTDETKKKHYSLVSKKLHDWLALSTGSIDGETPVKKLELLPAALKAYFNDAKCKWVFFQESNGALVPYFFKSAEYCKAYMDNGSYVPAVATLYLVAYKRGSQIQKSCSWYVGDVPKKDQPQKGVAKFLGQYGGYKETDEAIASYLEQIEKYTVLQTAVGLQMQAIGTGSAISGRSWGMSSTIHFMREGNPSKVVVDDESEEHSENRSGSRDSNTSITDSYWGEIPNRNGMADLDESEILEATDEPNRVELPIHPFVKVFDMTDDQWALIHVDNLSDYPWDKSLGDKLVLKQEDKDLIGLLCNQTGTQVDDIVKGKMAGVIVLATGTPGIGKTLTAEVFSEMIEKPLYMVQCSQLGLDVDQIEKNLEEILGRAARWGAILLIDEADVYIRRRENDIQQNAIVGVFLRLLEYYRGVIFMTSNRGGEIDDAIISRATAWIQYEKPSAEMQVELWKVLGKQYGAEFTAGQIAGIMADPKLSNLSGRTIRNLLKLARMLEGGEGVIGEATIKRVANYQALD